MRVHAPFRHGQELSESLGLLNEADGWNVRSLRAGFPQDCLRPGDHIIGVNGKRASGTILSNEIRDSAEVLLLLRRDV